MQYTEIMTVYLESHNGQRKMNSMDKMQSFCC